MTKLAILPAIACLAAPAFAVELATPEQISSIIIGNTVSGGMSDGAAYSEFYDPDGTIKAEGYTGSWYIESDEMCFDYGEGATCYALVIDGTQVTWILEAETVGTGTIAAGNPNAF